MRRNNVRVNVDKLSNGDVNKDVRIGAGKSNDYKYDNYDSYSDY